MRTQISQYLYRHRAIASMLALAALFGLGVPHNASATPIGTTADAKIVNVVTVSYADSAGNNTRYANASTTITVQLVKSALSTYLPPDGSTGVPGALVCPSSTQSYDSGSTIPFLYALAAKANGDTSYTLTKSNPAFSNVNNINLNMNVIDYAGANPSAIGTGGTAVTFGSATPVGTSGADTLLFPGGTLILNDFQANDIVLVNLTTGGLTAFLVDTITPGSAKTPANAGNAWHTTQGATGTETQDQMKLKAYQATFTLNGTPYTVGGNITPAFGTNAPVTGEPVGELKLVHVSVQASVTGASDGTVEYRLDTTDGTNTSNIDCTAGYFKGISLRIMKQVKNVTQSGSFGATADAKPGDILEYKVTVDNTAGLANLVVVTDPVPVYSKLVTWASGTAYGTTGVGQPNGTGAATDVFARISDGTNTVTVTVSGTDSETQPGAPTETGFGKAAGITANSTLTFYIGDESTNGDGGKVNVATDYTIIYQVKID